MLGQRIKELRKEKKLTQQELSKGIITRSYLSQIEQGLVQPSFDILEKLSLKLDCSVDTFFKTIENKDLLLSQVKKEIKTAENQIESNSYEKVEGFIQKKDYLVHKELNSYDRGILLWVHGKYYEHKKDYNHSLAFFEESITELESSKHTNEMLRSLDSLGYVHSQINNNEIALNLLNKAYRIMIYDQIQGVIRVSILVNLGIVHGKLKEYYSAINFLQEASDLNDKMGTYYKSGEIFMAMGICNMQLKRYKGAKDAYERALNFFKLSKNKYYQAGTYTNLGILSSYKKEYHQADLYLRTAINIYKSVGSKESEIMNVQVELARVYYLQEEYDKASSICHDVLQMEDVNKHTAQALELLGDICFKLSDIEDSLKHYNRAKDFLVTQSISCDHLCKKVADVYFSIGDYQKASDFYKECF
ncbi:XRE family transcriptional regulator (plasmid) [Priestia filamentosa]|uniref:XRE family transcriptional regulator n=1 Tax=Priestia filamentosa TaxID=1402861 RepID=A0A1X7GMP7_9BACI|nr:tetratricopeptide repeat protein [Priestia filamentosa]AWG44728.1 XRE family transcriptional regulator [Priestia filamentosa]OXS65026.1 XRE family transcriptional regulator [Priestia filamentosa]WRU97734.1 tetratricopeptide repeat protein [Priestia filamentosa]SMF72009.1 Transcriptional regulator, contains XRE-family HTH domain [Priestia filamentosa]